MWDTQPLRKHFSYAVVAIVVTAAAILSTRAFYPLRAVENMVEDVRIAFLSPPEPQNKNIAIISIDEETLAQLPYRSPIDRGFLKKLIEELIAKGVYAIGLDVLIDKATEPAKDTALKRLLAESKTPVILVTSTDPDTFTEAQRQYHQKFIQGLKTGFANLQTERLDGTVRQFESSAMLNGQALDSLPAALARLLKPGLQPQGERIAWRAPPNADTPPFPVYPAHAVSLLPKAWLEGRIVLIGTHLAGVDRHRTPQYLDPDRGKLAGVEIHAHVLAQMLDGRSYPRAALWLEVLTTLAMAACGVLLILWRGNLWVKLAAALVIVLLLWSGAFVLYGYGGPLLPLFMPTVTQGATAGLSAALSGFYSRRRAAEMQAAYLKSQEQLQETSEAKERIEHDLSMARDIQLNMVPSVFPAFPKRGDFDLHAVMDPAKAVGGDLYDFFLIDDDRLFFLIGDVSDKGVPAALFMAMTKTLFKSAITKSDADLQAVMYTVNNFLAQNNSSQQFVTIFACILDTRDGTVLYSDGGHDPPFILRKDSGVEMLQKKSGMAMGCFENIDYQTDSFVLNPGDAFLLYTDGVNEAMNPRRQMFEFERINRTLAPLCADAPPEKITSELFKQVKEFAGEAPQSDDITILALRYFGHADGAA